MKHTARKRMGRGETNPVLSDVWWLLEMLAIFFAVNTGQEQHYGLFILETNRAMKRVCTFKHYSPIANLAFMLKILERVYTSKFPYWWSSQFRNNSVSSYQKYCSTETALVKIQDEILTSSDQQGCAVILLRDLSAAFDTADHPILQNHLKHIFGIDDQAYQWNASYL